MGKYLKLFQEAAEYEQFKNSKDYILPNVSWIVSDRTIHLAPRPKPTNVGDIAYWDGSAVKFCTLDKWDNSLGTPVGVVVIPEGFAPDGKIRIISLKPVDASGNPSSSHVNMKWSNTIADTKLTNYTKVPTTDNAGSTSTGSNDNGYLPSDMFTGSQSYVDSEVKYIGSNKLMIPSPYLGDEPNPEYYKELSGNNALSDFNGLSNTERLSSACVAAKAAWKYNDGVSNLQWYLPAMGELGYIMPRFNKINTSISAVGGVAVFNSNYFWSSSEYSSNDAYRLYMTTGYVCTGTKSYTYLVRPFATV